MDIQIVGNNKKACVWTPKLDNLLISLLRITQEIKMLVMIIVKRTMAVVLTIGWITFSQMILAKSSGTMITTLLLIITL